MMFKKNEKGAVDSQKADKFWQEYEEKIGEKILARGLGRYISGWDEFDRQGWTGLWGLIIASSGGFRFHHFPQQSWLDAINFSRREAPKEKTFFIPNENIVSLKLKEEQKWWKKIIFTSSPQLFVNARETQDNELTLILEVDFRAEEFRSDNLAEKRFLPASK
jgi:hypothetical protein